MWRDVASDYKLCFCGHCCNTTTDITEANFFGRYVLYNLPSLIFVALKFRFTLSVNCSSTCCQTFGLKTPFEFCIFCCFTPSGIGRFVQLLTTHKRWVLCCKLQQWLNSVVFNCGVFVDFFSGVNLSAYI